MNDGLLSATQAAEALGVSLRTLDRYVASGLVTPARTPGGHRRFSTADIDALRVIPPEPGE